jgi:hypothetical protein
MARTASCSCGKLTVTCRGEPALVSLCHCLACQKRTGGPFGVAAFYRKKDVVVHGGSKSYRRASDSGFDIVFRFCDGCGSTVYWEPLRKRDFFAVAAGAFADPGFPAPTQEVHGESRHAWVKPL